MSRNEPSIHILPLNELDLDTGPHVIPQTESARLLEEADSSSESSGSPSRIIVERVLQDLNELEVLAERVLVGEPEAANLFETFLSGSDLGAAFFLLPLPGPREFPLPNGAGRPDPLCAESFLAQRRIIEAGLKIDLESGGKSDVINVLSTYFSQAQQLLTQEPLLPIRDFERGSLPLSSGSIYKAMEDLRGIPSPLMWDHHQNAWRTVARPVKNFPGILPTPPLPRRQTIPSLCQLEVEMCRYFYLEWAKAVKQDMWFNLLTDVQPPCIRHDFDRQNTIFQAKTNPGESLGGSRPDTLRLFFRNVDITEHIVQWENDQVSFKLPETLGKLFSGPVYLRQSSSAVERFWNGAEQACGHLAPPRDSFQVGPLNFLLLDQSIEIIYPPKIHKFTVNGNDAQNQELEACTGLKVSWVVGPTEGPLSLVTRGGELTTETIGCASYKITLKDRQGTVIKDSLPLASSAVVQSFDSERLILEVSVSDLNGEVGRDTRTIALRRMKRVTLQLLSDLNTPNTQLTSGSLALIAIRVSCPAPHGGLEVTLSSSNPLELPVTEKMKVPFQDVDVTIPLSIPPKTVGTFTISATAGDHETGHLILGSVDIYLSHKYVAASWTNDRNERAVLSYRVATRRKCLR